MNSSRLQAPQPGSKAAGKQQVPAGVKNKKANRSPGVTQQQGQRKGSSPKQEEYQEQQRQRGNDAESRSFRRALRFPQSPLPPVDPDDPDFEATPKAQKQALLLELEQQYGPHYSDSDVRLYLKQRGLNAARRTPSRRGGFPLDDSLPRPDTFLKLSLEFQRTVLNERCLALTGVLPRLSPADAWQLYTTIPGLLTLMTLQVAQRLHGLSHASGLQLPQLVSLLCGFRRLAFVHPNTVESRVGLLARVARLERRRAVLLMCQHPQLWLLSSKQLGPRAEELALLLGSCTVTALKLLGNCPQLLTTALSGAHQQLAALRSLLGIDPSTPAAVVPLLLWRPSLLLPQALSCTHGASAQQQQVGQQQQWEEHQWQQQQQHEGFPDADFTEQAEMGLAGFHTSSAAGSSVQAVQQLLQVLGSALQLSSSVVQQLVLQTPELLDLASSSSSSGSSSSQAAIGSGDVAWDGPTAAAAAAGSTVSAAVQALSQSWLCAGGASQTRQQYQQQLLQLLAPAAQQKKQTKHKQAASGHQQQQQQQGIVRYVAADALAYTAASCQWWASGKGFSSHQVRQLPFVQQLVVQAPALLVVAAARPDAAAAGLCSGVAAAAAAAPGTAAAAVGGLDLRLQSLCQQLLGVMAQPEQQQRQEQQQQYYDQKQQQWTSGLSTAGDVAAEGQNQHQLYVGQTQTRTQAAVAGTPQFEVLLEELRHMAVLEPSLLAQPPSFVVRQLAQLSKVLQDISCSSLWQLLGDCPTVLWLTEPQVFERIRVLCGVLKLPAPQVRARVLRPGVLPVLLLEPWQVKDNYEAVKAAAARWRSPEVPYHGEVLQLVRENVQLLLPGRN